MRIQRIRNAGVMSEFGNHLRSLRLEKNLTQEELAFRAEICTSQIARIESGKLNTTISTVSSLARALDMLPSDLFGWYAKTPDVRTEI